MDVTALAVPLALALLPELVMAKSKSSKGGKAVKLAGGAIAGIVVGIIVLISA